LRLRILVSHQAAFLLNLFVLKQIAEPLVPEAFELDLLPHPLFDEMPVRVD